MYKIRKKKRERKKKKGGKDPPDFLSCILTSELFTYTCNSLGPDCAAVIELHLRDEMKVVFMKNFFDPSTGKVTAGLFILSSHPAETAVLKPEIVEMKGFAVCFVTVNGLWKGNI